MASVNNDFRWTLFRRLQGLVERFITVFSVGQDGPDRSRQDVPESVGAVAGGDMPSDQRSVGDLYRKYAPSLYWVCMKYVKNKEDAEDMVNQVFVKIQKHLGGFKGQSGIYTWMYRIAVNECIQMFRKRKFEVDGASLTDLNDMVHFSPENQMNAKLILERITKDADAETVEILFLLYLEGLTQEEVVEKLGISRTTVHRKVKAFKIHAEKFR